MPPSVRRARPERSNRRRPGHALGVSLGADAQRARGGRPRPRHDRASCSCSSSPTSSGAPASTRPGPRTTSEQQFDAALDGSRADHADADDHRAAAHDRAVGHHDDHARRRPPSPRRGRRGRPGSGSRRSALDQVRGRGRRRRRPPQGPGPLPEHAAARARRATPRSPATAPPTARRSAISTSSTPGDEITRADRAGHVPLQGRSSSRSSTRARSACSTRTRPRATRPSARDAHAHDLQPEVLRRPQRLIIQASLELPAGQQHRSRRARTPSGEADDRSAGCRANRRRGLPTILWGFIAASSGCSGGCSSTVTRAGRRGASARSRSSSRSSSSTRTSSACCRRTTDRASRGSGLVDQRDQRARRDRVARLRRRARARRRARRSRPRRRPDSAVEHRDLVVFGDHLTLVDIDAG